MVIPSRHQESIRVLVEGIEVEKKVSNCKYLGVVIDNELKWTEHIGSIHKKLIKFTSIFYKLRHRLPAKILKKHILCICSSTYSLWY
jgi:hypothetical protein